MNKLLKKLMVGGSTAALAAVMPASVVFAQDQAGQDIEQVVVSASRITIAGYTQPTPVTVIGAAQLEASAYGNIADQMKELPQVTSPPSNVSSNSGGLTPAQGANFLDLRALGNIRTLTLFDGQRVVASSLLNAGVDVTTFPTTLIQRIDVVTGGASAAWGSDAVAGVVNFVLNKNFNGLKVNLEGSDTTDGLDRGLITNGAWGGDIFGGRGHLEIAGETRINPDTVLQTQEKWFRNPNWVSNPAYAPGNGQPQLIVANNVGIATTTEGGIINSSPAGVAGPGVLPAATNALRGIQFTGAGVPSVVNYGNLTLGSLTNGGSLTTTDGQWPAQQVASESNVYTLFGYGRYKLTDTIQASVQLNYGYYTGKTNGAFTAQQVTVRSDNAYIPASVASAMKNGGVTSFILGTLNDNNFNATTATGQNFYAQSQGSLSPITNRVRRELIRGVLTLEGTIGDDWSWNAYADHGGVRLWEKTANNPIQANLAAAEDAITVTAANVGKTGLALGSVACRQSLNGVNATAGTAPNVITAMNGCIPLDIFGNGVASPAAISYIDGAGTPENDFVNDSFKQEVFEGSMQGTLPWELPAGKVAVAFGMGYRKESAFGHAPPGLYGVAGAYGEGANLINFPSSSYNVIEGFGEVDAPILKNSIVNSLDFSMAGRMTSYSTSGLVETWKLGATSQINDDVKLRTTWSVDIRAPQINELFLPASSSFTTARDPKSQASVSYANVTTGNPNLLPEVARTISGGIVLTPTFVPGLTLSADWYSITITGEITTFNLTNLINQCNASLPSPVHPGQNGNPNDPLCATNLVFNGPNGALSTVYLQVLNINSQTTSGLDLAADYSMDFWDGTLSFDTKDNYNDENTTCILGQGCQDQAGTVSGGVTFGPKWKGIASGTYAAGPYSFTAQGRWFGTAVYTTQGNTGNQATAATANLYDPAHFETPFTAYLDLRGNYKWNDNISFYSAIDNVLNLPPALVAGSSASFSPGGKIYGTNGNIYPLLGRLVRIGVRLNY